MTMMEISSEVSEGMEKYGASQIIELCLPSKINRVSGPDGGLRPAPIFDRMRDQYLARALVLQTLGSWMGNWKRMSQCPKCGKFITRTKPITVFEEQRKAVVCDDCLRVLKAV